MFFVLRQTDMLGSASGHTASALVGHLIGERWKPDPDQSRLRAARSTVVAVRSMSSRLTSNRSASSSDNNNSNNSASAASSNSASSNASAASSSNSVLAPPPPASADQQREQRLADLSVLFGTLAPLVAQSDEATSRVKLSLLAELRIQQQADQRAATVAAQSALHVLPPSSLDPLTVLRPPPARATHANSAPAVSAVSSKPAASASTAVLKPAGASSKKRPHKTR